MWRTHLHTGLIFRQTDKSKSKQSENTRAHVLKCKEPPRHTTRDRRGWRQAWRGSPAPWAGPGPGGEGLCWTRERGQEASAPRCPGLVLEPALHPRPPEPLWPSCWQGAPASPALVPGPPGLCSPGPGIPAGHGRSDGQREGRAFTASLEAPGLSGSVSRRPLWGPSPWADASVCRGSCEEAQVPPAVPAGGTRTPDQDRSLFCAPSPLSPPEGPGRPLPWLHGSLRVLRT